MTQEVQPLAWQKRTNLEEHQQFFSKINEIIANLAPTVNEAEQAIAQATAAIASANDAVATANAASAAASAAASQAQTAASTVAGYDGRLTAAEGDIDALQAADGQNVKISRINEYAVGLTGNQPNIAGNKGFTGNVNVNFLRTIGADGYRRINIDRSDDELAVAPAATVLYPLIAWNDKDNNMMSAIYVSHQPDGTTSISVQTRNSDGTIKYSTIAKGDVI